MPKSREGHHNLSVDPAASQFNLLHMIRLYSSATFILLHRLLQGLPSGLFYMVSPSEMLHTFLNFPFMLCAVHKVFYDLFINNFV